VSFIHFYIFGYFGLHLKHILFRFMTLIFLQKMTVKLGNVVFFI